MKKKTTGYEAYVCTTPETIEADKPGLSCRVALKIDNTHDSKSVPAPFHTGPIAAVSRNRKGERAAK
jgi:hypothetical protein